VRRCFPFSIAYTTWSARYRRLSRGHLISLRTPDKDLRCASPCADSVYPTAWRNCTFDVAGARPPSLEFPAPSFAWASQQIYPRSRAVQLQITPVPLRNVIERNTFPIVLLTSNSSSRFDQSRYSGSTVFVYRSSRFRQFHTFSNLCSRGNTYRSKVRASSCGSYRDDKVA
jgi:hypothetical protein